MYLRRCYRNKDGKRHAYWALVESHRTARGPRQRVVSWLGQMDSQGRLGVQQAAQGATGWQQDLFDNQEPQWVEVDLKRVAVERSRRFGGAWLGLEVCRRLGLPEFLDETIATGREDIPWPVMALVLVLGRLCDPASELHLAEHFFASSALGELFSLDYDLLLYDVTSTYFEGQVESNALAQRGYSRDHRGDCKQVNIALVVSRCGMPVGYELFAGNTADVSTVENMVEHVEGLYGKANRIWVMDRGMASQSNMEFLQQEGRRYIVGTPKSMLKQYERELLAADWKQVHEGLEVRLCPAPDGAEVFILCRSAQRTEKERAMHDRFEKKIEEGLKKIGEACKKKKQKLGAIERRVGALLGSNTRAAGLFQVQVEAGADGHVVFRWTKNEAWREWAQRSEGCYMLRSNVADWSPEELWRAYIQLTEAEEAFRIQKSDLRIRPVWHQRQERVEAHILVCFLTYVLWRTLGQMCRAAGLGDEPRKVFAELSELAVVDVVLPARNGVTIRKRCVARPDEHQAILLQRLGLALPASLELFRL
jgi:hypothetical protein